MSLHECLKKIPLTKQVNDHHVNLEQLVNAEFNIIV